MSDRKPDAWVVCGDKEFSPEDTPPNWGMTTPFEQEARYWSNDCHLRVRPVYVGEPVAFDDEG